MAVADLLGETFGLGVGDTVGTLGEPVLDLGVEGFVVDSDLENRENQVIYSREKYSFLLMYVCPFSPSRP